MANKFERRHYEAIAKCLLGCLESETLARDGYNKFVHYALVGKFAAMFKADNLNFDIQRFTNAAVGTVGGKVVREKKKRRHEHKSSKELSTERGLPNAVFAPDLNPRVK